MANKENSSKLDKLKRIRLIQELILKDYSTGDIVTHGKEAWGLSERQIHRYISEAYEMFKELSEKNIERRLYFHIQRRMKLLRDLEKKNTKGSTDTALDILDSMAEIEGLKKKRVEMTGENGKDLFEGFKIKIKKKVQDKDDDLTDKE
jgi:hypothetical protein